MKNRFISLLAAIILLFASLAVILTGNAVFTAGAGDKDDANIESFEDLASLLNFIKESDNKSLYAEVDKKVKLLSKEVTLIDSEGNNNSGDTDKEGGSKHESVTVHISTTHSSSSSTDNPKYTGGIVEARNSINRELTHYITPEGSFYVSCGMLTSYKKINSSDYKDKEARSYEKWDIQLFVNGENAFVFINEFININNEASVQIKTENKGKWIKISPSMVSEVVDIDYENREVLGALGEMLDILIKHDYISQDKTSVSLDEDALADLLEKEGEDPVSLDDVEIDFTVDISNPTAPLLSSISDEDSKKEEKVLTGYENSGFNVVPTYDYYTITKKSTTVQNISIKNIDNTVINFNTDNVSIEARDAEEFEKLFITEEVDDNDE